MNSDIEVATTEASESFRKQRRGSGEASLKSIRIPGAISVAVEGDPRCSGRAVCIAIEMVDLKGTSGAARGIGGPVPSDRPAEGGGEGAQQDLRAVGRVAEVQMTQQQNQGIESVLPAFRIEVAEAAAPFLALCGNIGPRPATGSATPLNGVGATLACSMGNKDRRVSTNGPMPLQSMDTAMQLGSLPAAFWSATASEAVNSASLADSNASSKKACNRLSTTQSFSLSVGEAEAALGFRAHGAQWAAAPRYSIITGGSGALPCRTASPPLSPSAPPTFTRAVTTESPIRTGAVVTTGDVLRPQQKRAASRFHPQASFASSSVNLGAKPRSSQQQLGRQPGERVVLELGGTHGGGSNFDRRSAPPVPAQTTIVPERVRPPPGGVAGSVRAPVRTPVFALDLGGPSGAPANSSRLLGSVPLALNLASSRVANARRQAGFWSLSHESSRRVAASAATDAARSAFTIETVHSLKRPPSADEGGDALQPSLQRRRLSSPSSGSMAGPAALEGGASPLPRSSPDAIESPLTAVAGIAPACELTPAAQGSSSSTALTSIKHSPAASATPSATTSSGSLSDLSDEAVLVATVSQGDVDELLAELGSPAGSPLDPFRGGYPPPWEIQSSRPSNSSPDGTDSDGWGKLGSDGSAEAVTVARQLKASCVGLEGCLAASTSQAAGGLMLSPTAAAKAVADAEAAFMADDFFVDLAAVTDEPLSTQNVETLSKAKGDVLAIYRGWVEDRDEDLVFE